MSTVQAPHCPSPQPYLAPVRSSSSRRTESRLSSAPISTRRRALLTSRSRVGTPAPISARPGPDRSMLRADPAPGRRRSIMRLVRFVVCCAALQAGTSAPVARAEAPEATVSVDLTKTRPAISKYVYGQFIEHLGRCIYGGLWSEMLEDRKFFYPVDGEAPAWALFQPGPRSYDGEGHPYELLVRSPWLILGARQALTMDRQRPWAGEQTPVIAVDGKGAGLMQERLGLVEGRRYVGRIVLAGASTAAPVHISLAWGAGASDRQ